MPIFFLIFNPNKEQPALLELLENLRQLLFCIPVPDGAYLGGQDSQVGDLERPVGVGQRVKPAILRPHPIRAERQLITRPHALAVHHPLWHCSNLRLRNQRRAIPNFLCESQLLLQHGAGLPAIT